MRIVEWRVFLPIDAAKYEQAEQYMVARRTIEESNGQNEGTETLTNEYSEELGIHSHKIYHYTSRIPWIIRWALPKGLLDFHEECWAKFPRNLCKFSAPYLGDRLDIAVDSFTVPFDPSNGFDNIDNNIAKLTEEELSLREIRYMDIISQEPQSSNKTLQLVGFSCPSLGIPEFQKPTREFDYNRPPEWTEHYTGTMLLTVKVVKVKFAIWGMQTKIENLLSTSAIPNVFLDSVRAIIAWSPEWSRMTPEEIRNYVDHANESVSNQFKGKDFGHTPEPLPDNSSDSDQTKSASIEGN